MKGKKLTSTCNYNTAVKLDNYLKGNLNDHLDDYLDDTETSLRRVDETPAWGEMKNPKMQGGICFMFPSIPKTLLSSLSRFSFKGVGEVIRLLERRRFYKAWEKWRDILNLYPISCFYPQDWRRLREITDELGGLAVDELEARGGYPK